MSTEDNFGCLRHVAIRRGLVVPCLRAFSELACLKGRLCAVSLFGSHVFAVIELCEDVLLVKFCELLELLLSSFWVHWGLSGLL